MKGSLADFKTAMKTWNFRSSWYVGFGARYKLIFQTVFV